MKTYKPFLRLPYCDRSRRQSRAYVPGGLIAIGANGARRNRNAEQLATGQLLKIGQVAQRADAARTPFPEIEKKLPHRARVFARKRIPTTDGSRA